MSKIMWIILIFIVACFIWTAVDDSGLLDGVSFSKNDSQVGSVEVYDGISYTCKQADSNGNCTYWDPLQETATDVLDAVGENAVGVSKSPSPPIEGEGAGVAFFNAVNSVAFSIHVSLGISIYASLLLMALVAYVLLLLIISGAGKGFTVGTILAPAVLPGYVILNSVAVLEGGKAAMVGLNMCGGILVTLCFIAWLASKMDWSSTHEKNVNGETFAQTRVRPRGRQGK